MKKTLFIHMFLIVLIISSCDYFKFMSNKEWIENTGDSEIEIYVGGFDGENACYWKLDDSGNIKKTVIPDEAYYGIINSIYVYKDNVYTAGAYFTGTSLNACYWENSDIHYLELENPAIMSWVKSISIIDNKIHLTGSQPNTSGIQIACYWLDDKVYNLSSNISVSNSLYIKNYMNTSTLSYFGGQNDTGAGYWKNWGKGYIDLSISGSDSSVVNSIYNVNDKIYAIGTFHVSGATDYYVCYWIDGVPYTTSYTANRQDSAYGFVAQNTDIHIIYYDGVGSHYLRNGNLETTAPNSELKYVYVFESDIYFCGSVGTTNQYAAFWREDDCSNPIILSENTGSSATSIYVRYKK